MLCEYGNVLSTTVDDAGWFGIGKGIIDSELVDDLSIANPEF
jgi:hypothetical protein